MKPIDRPLRLSAFIAFAKKKSDEEAAAVGWDEMRGALAEIGVSPKKIAAMKDKGLIDVRTMRGMSDREAFNFLVDQFKHYLVELEVDQSVIHALRFE